jgi:hypothetical protein
VNFTRSLFSFLFVIFSCASSNDPQAGESSLLTIKQDKNQGILSVFRSNTNQPLLVQNAKAGIRPYIHPIVAPDGKGELTEFSPAHHKHQTGLYWGLKQVNGRDFFMNWKDDHWRRISAEVLDEKGVQVRWRTVYNLLDEKGGDILTETQTWAFREQNGKYILDLEWRGEALVDLTMGKFYVGGLFLRMPWRQGIRGEVINSGGERNAVAEGHRALWNDIGIQVDGREDLAHIAILDHPDNKDFPVPWRVDNELGVGPSRQILGDWILPKGETEIICYRLMVYTGDFDRAEISNEWKEFVCDE